jgi:hypothetical protein
MEDDVIRRHGVMAMKREPEPTFVCVICGEPYAGIGHDPAPIANEGECCDVCRLVSVLPYRDAELPSQEPV